MADGAMVNAAPAVVPAVKRPAKAAALFIAPGKSFVTEPVETIDLTTGGIPGDRHANMIVPSDVRKPWHPRGTMIFNDRMLSLVSVEELAVIRQNLAVPDLKPEWLGANILVSGLARLSWLPRGTRLIFPSGATLVVSDMNHPCRHAGGAIMAHYPERKGLDFEFVKAGDRLRGIVAFVERPGLLRAGESFEVRVPEQYVWEG